MRTCVKRGHDHGVVAHGRQLAVGLIGQKCALQNFPAGQREVAQFESLVAHLSRVAGIPEPPNLSPPDDNVPTRHFYIRGRIYASRFP